MMRLNESDTYSDMPPLMGTSEIRLGCRDTDSESIELTNPGDLQELVISHSAPVESESHPQNLDSRGK